MSGGSAVPGATGDEGRSSLTIDSLPNGLLRRVMAAAGCESRRSLLLVSKRWQRCCCGEPSLWNPFRIPWRPDRFHPVTAHAQQQWLDASFSVLERVSGLVTDLHVESSSLDFYTRLPPSWVAALAAAALHHLAHQRLPMLAAVQIRWYEPHLDLGMLKALAHFSGSLTRLELKAAQLPLQAAGVLRSQTSLRTLQLVAYGAGGRAVLPHHIINVLYRLAALEVLHVSFGLDDEGASSLAAALPRLLRLRSLECRPVLTDALLASVAGLTGLTCLDLDYTLPPDGAAADLQLLTRLHSLARLQLVGRSEAQEGQHARWPLPSQFTSLHSYNLRHSSFSLAEEDCHMDCCAFDWEEGLSSVREYCGSAAGRRLVLRPHAGGSLPGRQLGQLLDGLTASLPSDAIQQLQYDGPLHCACQLASSSQVSAVTSIAVCGSGAAALPGLALPRLQALTIRLPYEQPASLLLLAAQLPALSRLCYSGNRFYTCGYLSTDASVLPHLVELASLCSPVGTSTTSRYPVWRSIAISDSALPALQQLVLCTKRLCLAGARLPALTSLRLTADSSFDWELSETDGMLRIASSQLPALQSIQANGYSTLRLLCTLPALSSLELTAVEEACTVQAAAGALPALRSVALSSGAWFDTAHPAATLEWLASLPKVTAVKLGNLSLLDDLPEGPWLASLERLELLRCMMPRLPAALRHATRLTSLAASPAILATFTLRQEDVDSILRPLTQLRQLDLPWLHCCHPPLFIHLFSTLRNLPMPDAWPPNR